MKFAAEVAKFAKFAEEKGFMNSLEGNVSTIDRETGNIYITPSHKMKATLTPEEVCIVNPEGEQIGGTGMKSSEFFLHEACYKARPDCGAVFHCHVPYLTAYASLLKDFEVPEYSVLHPVFKTIKCLPYGKRGTHAIHQGIEEALEGRPMVLLGHHGVVCIGENLEDAIGILEAGETMAKMVHVVNQMKSL